MFSVSFRSAHDALRRRTRRIVTSPRASAVIGGATLAGTGVLTLLWAALPSDVVLSTLDAAHLYLPIKVRTALAFEFGHLPLWTPEVGCGVPFLANPMTQALYPGNTLFALLPAIPGMKAFVAIHLAGAAVAFYWLAGTYTRRRAARALGAVTFAASGAIVSLHWNPLWIAGLPWLLVALHSVRSALRGTGFGAYATIALALAMLIFAGAFEIAVGFAWLAGVEVVAALLGSRDRKELTPSGECADTGRGSTARTLLARCGGLAGAAAVAAAVGAVQLLPTLELLGETSRASGLGGREAGEWSLVSARLLETVAPGAFGNSAVGEGWSFLLGGSDLSRTSFLAGLYLGVPALALAIAAITRARRETIVVAGLLVVCVLLALGDATPAFAAAREFLPGVALFRYPVKLFAFAMVPLALLVTLGAAAVFDRDERATRAASWCGAMLTFALTLGVVLHAAEIASLKEWMNVRSVESERPLDTDALASMLRWSLVHGALVGGAWLAWLARWKRRESAALIVLLVAGIGLDLTLVNRRWVAVTPAERIAARPRELPPPSALWAPAGERRIGCVLPGPYQYFYDPYLAALHGYRATLDYGSVSLRTHAELDGAAQASSLGSDRRLELSAAAVRVRLSETRELLVEPLPRAVPRAYLVPRASIATDDAGARWYAGTPEFDPLTEVILSDAPLALAETGRDANGRPTGGGASGQVAIEVDRPREVRIDVKAERDSFLVLTDSWYPGWEVEVDGEQREIYRANLAFRAVPLTSGRHEVVFSYRPRSVARGLAISSTSIVGALAIALVVLGRRLRGRTVALRASSST